MDTAQEKKIDIFDYFDYYEYIKDMYHFLKSEKPEFSFRVFARDAGIPSHSYFLRIVKRERKLSIKYVDNFCNALKLNVLESQYLKTLVHFNNEKKAEKKEFFLKELLQIRYRRNDEYRLSDEKLQFFQKWYYPVIRELAVLVDFKDDYALLAKRCMPKITEKQAASAVHYLLKNDFIKKSGDGRYKLVDYFITSGPEVTSTVFRRYHRETIKIASEDVDRIKQKDRDVSSLVMRVNKNTYVQMKKEIADFRKHLLNMARESDDPDMVCFVGMQLLPRSKGIKQSNSLDSGREL